MRDVIPLPTPEGRKPLTDRQAAILATIQAFRAINGYAPTYRDLQVSLVPPIRNLNGVKCQVDALAKKGYIHPAKGLSRALVVIE